MVDREDRANNAPAGNKGGAFFSRLKTAASIMLRGEARPKPGAQRLMPIPAITLEEVAEAKTFFPMDKYFIFGHARSGTTLLTRLVRLHPEVHCGYQAHFFTRLPLLEGLAAGEDIRLWLSRGSNRWNRGRDLSPVVLRAAADFIMEREARRLGKRVVGDKSPNSLLDGQAVELMLKVYPEARLVFIVRDGRDAMLSHRFQAFIDSPQNLSAVDARIRQDFIQNPEPFLSGQRSLFTEKGFRQAAEGWVHNVVETDATARQRLGDNYLSLRYEDLLANPHPEMERLWAFLGVDPLAPGLAEILDAEMQRNPDADWQQQKAGQDAPALAALNKGKAGSWRNLFTPADRAAFQAIAGKTLATWGYPLTEVSTADEGNPPKQGGDRSGTGGLYRQ